MVKEADKEKIAFFAKTNKFTTTPTNSQAADFMKLLSSDANYKNFASNTTYAKTIMQAAQSMLAQANQSSYNALSLLQ